LEYEVHVSDRAGDDLLEIAAWIARDSPVHAVRWMDDLWTAVESLRQYPERCPIAAEAKAVESEIRHLIVGDYRILFTIRTDRVFVLSIRHAARQMEGRS
jgi:plasmid stabilization system protein ParE